MMITLRNELIDKPDSTINKPYFEILTPSSIFIFVATLYVLYYVRFVEMCIGSLRTLLIIFVSLLLDFAIRFIFLLKLGIKIKSTGPFAMITALLCIYCILFPTYRLPVFEINDKLAMFLVLSVSGLFSDLYAVVPVLCGILSFVLLSPIVIPLEKDKDI